MTSAQVPGLSTEDMLQALEADLQLSVSLLDDPRLQPMTEMIAYHFGWSESRPEARGKRLRPLLTLLCCAAGGGDWPMALPAASAVELIHNFSLIHDDIQDNSAERRGRATVWKRWGIAQAINTGDALLVLAHLAVGRLTSLGTSAAAALDVHSLLDDACLDLTRGQHLDLAFEDRVEVAEFEYLEMIQGKTAALLAAATGCGARLAATSQAAIEAYRLYGLHLGMAFQILDDILGIWGTPEVTGKPAGDDLRAHKKSLPILFGMDHSPTFRQQWASQRSDEDAIREMTNALEKAGGLEYARREAEDHTEQALHSLSWAVPSGPAGEELQRLTRRLLQRDR